MQQKCGFTIMIGNSNSCLSTQTIIQTIHHNSLPAHNNLLVHLHPPDHVPQPPVALQEVLGVAPVTVVLSSCLPGVGGRQLPVSHWGLPNLSSNCYNFYRKIVIIFLGILSWFDQQGQVFSGGQVVPWEVEMLVCLGCPGHASWANSGGPGWRSTRTLTGIKNDMHLAWVMGYLSRLGVLFLMER